MNLTNNEFIKYLGLYCITYYYSSYDDHFIFTKYNPFILLLKHKGLYY